MKKETVALLLLGTALLIVLFMTLLCSQARGQTVCVDPPLQAEPDFALQAHVGELFRSKGAIVDCAKADYAVSFYQSVGTSAVDVTDFGLQFATARGVVLGTVVISHPQVPYGAWTMAVRKPGRVAVLYRTHASSLDGAVKRVVKTLNN